MTTLKMLSMRNFSLYGLLKITFFVRRYFYIYVNISSQFLPEHIVNYWSAENIEFAFKLFHNEWWKLLMSFVFFWKKKTNLNRIVRLAHKLTFFKRRGRKNKLRKLLRKSFTCFGKITYYARLLWIKLFFCFLLNEKPVFLFPLFFWFYTSLGGKVSFIVTYRGYINCCILVNSVLQSLLSAFIQTRNVSVERWRKYETNFIMELQP